MMCEDREQEVSREQLAFLKQRKRRKAAVFFMQWAILAGFFLLWEGAARWEWIDPFLFSCPSRMAETLGRMAADGSLWLHLSTTFLETAAGFLLGTVLGTLIAVLLWWNSFISAVAQPYLVVLNSLPKTALAPILIVWIGNNQRSIIAVALLTSVVVTVLSVLNGFLQVDGEKRRLAEIFGGTKRQVLQKVVFPANIPCIVNALKINVGLSFVGVIVGEFLVAKAGLGFLIVYGSQVFKMDLVLVSVVLLAGMAAVMYGGIGLLERKLSKK